MALAELIANGNELVLVTGLAIHFDACESQLQQVEGIISLSSEDCIDLFAQHLHPMSQACFWNSRWFTRMPSQMFFWKGNHTLEMRCCHLHPLFIKHPVPMSSPSSTIDGDYLKAYQDRPMQVVQDNRIVILSLSRAQELTYRKQTTVPLSAFERCRILDTLIKVQRPIHQWFFTHSIQLKGATLNEQDINHQIQPLTEISVDSFHAWEQFWLIEQEYHQGQF
jgi:hypothetical protein